MDTPRSGAVEGLLLKIPMPIVILVTVFLPAVALAACFITAFIFHFDEVNETMCDLLTAMLIPDGFDAKSGHITTTVLCILAGLFDWVMIFFNFAQVKNFIPSVSAVTGIKPQSYIWRTCIALHSAPRFTISVIYYNHYMSRRHLITSHRQQLFKSLVRLNFWLHFVENSCAILTAFVGNKENYPLHENIFIIFMVSSQCYMLLNTVLFKWTREKEMTVLEKTSYRWKKGAFVLIASATVGLIFFFFQHRLYCVAGAFSMFSVCEYTIGYTNMAYHFSCILDFKDKHIIFGTLHLEESATNGATPTAAFNKSLNPSSDNTRIKQKHH